MSEEITEAQVEEGGGGFPRFFRLGTLPIMVCVVREDRQFGVGISVANLKWWDPERAKAGSLASAGRAIAKRLAKRREEEALDP